MTETQAAELITTLKALTTCAGAIWGTLLVYVLQQGRRGR